MPERQRGGQMTALGKARRSPRRPGLRSQRNLKPWSHFQNPYVAADVRRRRRRNLGESAARATARRFRNSDAIREVTARLAEGEEVRRLPREGQARQHLLQVAGEARAILRRMQDAIDVVKDVLLCDATRRVRFCFARSATVLKASRSSVRSARVVGTPGTFRRFTLLRLVCDTAALRFIRRAEIGEDGIRDGAAPPVAVHQLALTELFLRRSLTPLARLFRRGGGESTSRSLAAWR